MANNKPTPERVKRRACELLALGLTWAEVTSATGISRSTLADMLKTEPWRGLVDTARQEKQSIAAQTANVVQDLLTAKTHDGTPDLHLRKIGAELYAKNPALIDAATAEPSDELLPGCVLRVIMFPKPPDMP